MTARIQKAFSLLAGLHYNNRYYVNSYNIDLSFNVESDSIVDQNVAIERVKFYLHECLQHCVFINQTDTQSILKYSDAGMNICTLPEEPYDQVIAIMLMVKLNAITEGRLVISDIAVESDMSDGVNCLMSIEENVGPFNEKGWWADNSQNINDLNRNTKVVKLSKLKNEWQESYLDWEEKTRLKDSPEIIFTSFDKMDK